MSEANWYVIHTYSGYENKVKANIDKTVANRHLEEQILDVIVPLEDVQETKNGVTRMVKRKMFPGYVLVHMEMNDDTWYVVRNTRGVTGFVGPGSKPVPLAPDEAPGKEPKASSRRSTPRSRPSRSTWSFSAATLRSRSASRRLRKSEFLRPQLRRS